MNTHYNRRSLAAIARANAYENAIKEFMDKVEVIGTLSEYTFLTDKDVCDDIEHCLYDDKVELNPDNISFAREITGNLQSIVVLKSILIHAIFPMEYYNGKQISTAIKRIGIDKNKVTKRLCNKFPEWLPSDIVSDNSKDEKYCILTMNMKDLLLERYGIPENVSNIILERNIKNYNNIED